MKNITFEDKLVDAWKKHYKCRVSVTIASKNVQKPFAPYGTKVDKFRVYIGRNGKRISFYMHGTPEMFIKNVRPSRWYALQKFFTDALYLEENGIDSIEQYYKETGLEEFEGRYRYTRYESAKKKLDKLFTPEEVNKAVYDLFLIYNLLHKKKDYVLPLYLQEVVNNEKRKNNSNKNI